MNKTETTQDYRSRESRIFRTIPGMNELLKAPPSRIPEMEARYPDAAFALRTANSLFNHDRDLSIITQRAYFSILNGESIPNVRHRYDRDMDQYVKRHMWDD